MGWRYRKSVTLFPGVRVNFGLRSSSISFGGRGFRTTYSSTGRVTHSVGIPGTGLSYVTSSSNSSRIQQRRNQPVSASAAPSRTLGTPTYQVSQSLQPDPAEIAERIRNIYRTADETINWKEILISDGDGDTSEEWAYYKQRAERVLNWDIDTYFELISDLNPLDDLMEYGSEFECGTDDPRMLSIHFKANSSHILRDAQSLSQQEYNLLLQDYVCGCAIRVARDMFALLPLRHLIVDAEDEKKDILSVDFDRRSFLNLNFESLDASDTISEFPHRMRFTLEDGFHEIKLLDS